MKTDYYVYALFRETGQPFYIGKGRGSRTAGTLNPKAGPNKYKNRVLLLTKKALGTVPCVILHSALDEATAFLYEAALVAAIGRYPKGPLTNMTDGGGGVRNLSPEARAVMSQKLTGNKNSFGVIHTVETRAKLSLSKVGNAYNKGRKQTPEHIANKAASLKRWAATPEGKAQLSRQSKGRKLSPEAIEKMKASKTGKKLTEEHKAKLRVAQRASWTPERRQRHGLARKRYFERLRQEKCNATNQDNRLP